MESFFAEILGENKISYFVQLGRPWNGSIIGLVGVLGYVLLFDKVLFLLPLIFLFLSFTLLYMGGTTLNDISDFEVDRINMPYRPLQKKALTFTEAYSFAFICYLVGFLLSLFLPFPFYLWALLFIIFSFIYSRKPFALESRSILGNINLALVTILIPAIGGGMAAIKDFYLLGDFVLPFLLFTLLFFFISFFKDLKDVDGDKAKGKNTFAVFLGAENVRKLGFFGILISFPLFWVSFSKFFDANILFYVLGFLSYLSFLAVSFFPFNIEKEVMRFTVLRLLFLFVTLVFLFFTKS